MKFKNIAITYEIPEAFANSPIDLLIHLRKTPKIKAFLIKNPNLASDIDNPRHPALTTEHKIVLLKVILADQGDVVFAGWEKFGKSDNCKKSLADYLLALEKFYGIIEYGRAGKRCIDINTGKVKTTAPVQTIEPTQLLRSYNLQPEQEIALKKAVLAALEAYERIGQAWVIGGAAARLNFKDRSGKPLPQGEFPVDVDVKGRTLFRLYFDDLLAQTALHYHLTGRSYKQPVAAMSSWENDARIADTFVGEQFYGYGREHILIAPQPLVPVIGEDYLWCMDPKNPYKILQKPHGHGDYYQVMNSSGVFARLQKLGIESVLMRQVNNPLAHRVAFEALGLLLEHNKKMVFATIPRRATAPEGALVMSTERTPDGKYVYKVFNVEYSELRAAGITDVPMAGTKELSPFGGNLNCFAFSLADILNVMGRERFPGELINLKKLVVTTRDGKVVAIKADRLESQMQGMALLFEINSDRELNPVELAKLLPVVTFDGQREEIFYVSKESPDIRNGHINDTPLSTRKAIIDRRVAWLLNAGMDIPHRNRETVTGDKYPESLKDVVVFFSTVFALNSEILQSKVIRGRLGAGSYLEIDGEHVRLEDVDLEGSLMIRPENRIGTKEPDGEEIPNPEKAGKVRLENVRVRNNGSRKRWRVQILVPGLEERKEGAPYSPLTREQAREFGLSPGEHLKYGINPESVEKHRRNLDMVYGSGQFGEDNQYIKVLKTSNDNGGEQGKQNQKWGYSLVWMGEYEEDSEALEIDVQGNGEFYAKDVTLEGNLHFTVPAGRRVSILPSPDGNGYVIKDEPIETPSWHYTVSVNKDLATPNIFEVKIIRNDN